MKTLDPAATRTVQARYLVDGDVDSWTGKTVAHVSTGWATRYGTPFPAVWIGWSDTTASGPIHAHSYVAIAR